MLAGFLIGLREGLEAALIVGLVLGILAQMKQERYRNVVWAGVAVAILLSLATAGMLHLLGASLEGTVEEIFEGAMMLLAAGVLTGSMLKALFGYNGNPALTESLAYVLYLAGISFGIRWIARKSVNSTQVI